MIRTILFVYTAGSYGEFIESPDFESEWLRITAQSTKSEVHVYHGLETVPAIVEVLVKAIDGPNKDFIFKAIGTDIPICFMLVTNCLYLKRYIMYLELNLKSLKIKRI